MQCFSPTNSLGYHSWRRLGDVIGSLFALGYHEPNEDATHTPAFLMDLRRAAFARTYSADKNISIFLGRPPRLHRKYCRLQLPGQRTERIHKGDISRQWKQFQWPRDENFDYKTETCWSALCALLKEEILEIFQNDSNDGRFRQIGLVRYGFFRHKYH